MTLSSAVEPSRRALVVAGALVVANLTLFVLIAEDLLDGGGLIARDQAVLEWFIDHRTDSWISAARLVSAVGGFAPLAIVGVVVAGWLWHRGSPLTMAAAPLVSLVLASLASTTAKALFDRDRPPVALHAATVTLAAFPSGHATDAAAFFLATALTLALTVAHSRWLQAVFIAVGLFLAGLVGLSRLVLAVHWLSDVVAGWALGSAFAIAVVTADWYVTARRAGAGSDRTAAVIAGPSGTDS